MPAKLDFLKDMREHPNTTGGETAARLDVSEGAILEVYRRSRRQGLLEGDGARPEKFKLTDFGLQQLRVLSGEDNPRPGAPANVEQKLSELEERMADTVEDVKGLFGLVDRVLQAKRTSAPESNDRVSELLEENTQLKEQLSQQAKVFEFYAVRIGLAEHDGRHRLLKKRGKRLTAELEPETAKLVERLVSLEEELCNEESRGWGGPREEKVRKLQDEIAALREKLGFVALAASSEDEEERDKDGW
jgi:DNA-binding Lrp family transcriptional regulator